MRWIVFVMIFLAAASPAFAAGPDDQFVDIYNQILQAQNIEASGQTATAVGRYREALSNLQQLQAGHPSWNPVVVKFRLEFLQEKLAQLTKPSPASNPIVAVSNAPPVVAAPPVAVAVDPAAAWRAQIDALNASNAQLQQKLKEALSVQPTVTPEEMTQAQQKIEALQKENDLLKVTLDQQKGASATNTAATEQMAGWTARLTEATNKISALTNTIAQLTNSVAALQAKMADETTQLNTLQAAAQSAPKNEDLQKLTDERDHLKEALDQRTRDLADAEAHGAQLQELAAQAHAAAAAQEQSARLGAQVDQLRARLAALEATPVPYTADELAILKQPAVVSAAAAAPPPESSTASAPTNLPIASSHSPSALVKHGPAHTAKDLPPGAGALMADASRAAMERDFKAAEDKYNEVLSQDENNVFVLAHLASAQFEAGETTNCEKTVLRALALDSDDPGALYLLGILRYRQDRLDDALDALSRSAQANPTNAGTENYLGCVLADKGQRPAAETAFRKALKVEPEYADAHYNLAFVYATEKPPSLELARWHYARALDLHHPKNEPLEKLLGVEK